MEKSTDLGMNRTGAQMSPKESKEAEKGALKYSPDFTGKSNEMKKIRQEAIANAQPVGTVPLPGKFKGVVKTGMKAMTGKDAGIFVDKLGERLAFERAGVRLYEALIAKCEVIGFGTVDFKIDTLKHYQKEEAEHFEMLTECLKKLGADPTSMTPSADIAGLASEGHLKVITDPRTSVAACVQSILALELLDNEGWELLVELAQGMGEEDMVKKFKKAIADEEEHLKGIRLLYSQLVKAEESIVMEMLQ